MWGNFISYFGQNQTQDNSFPVTETDGIDGEWVLVDIEGNEIERNATEETPPETSKVNLDNRLSPLPLLDISNASSPQSSPQLSPTKIEEGWFVAPPPCFTKKNAGHIEISPLEDLLIEHPSMSVYARVPSFYLTDVKGEDDEDVCPPKGNNNAAKRTTETRVVPNLLKKTSTKSAMTCTKSQLDLKSLIDQAENMKPAQQAKWESDQYKLCPSYINRQNRVHRYQSRKHHNQKKKSISKPFAEKGRHSF